MAAWRTLIRLPLRPQCHRRDRPIPSREFWRLTLAAVGIYSTMSVYVGSRTKEFGIRLALGAQPGVLRRAVLRQGMWLTAVGVVTGIVGALVLTRTIKSLLFEVSATDPLVFTAIPVLLVIVSLVACYTPARRATKVDPLVALRDE